METVGDKPSLRFKVNIANPKTMYLAEDKPPMLDGFEFITTTVAGKGKYDQGNLSILLRLSTGRKSSGGLLPMPERCRISFLATRASSARLPIPRKDVSMRKARG